MLMEMNNLFVIKNSSSFFLSAVAAIVFLMTGCAVTTPGTDLQQSPEPSPTVQSSENSLYYYTESQLQMNKGHLDSALAFMQLAIAHDPDSMFLQRELAQLYWQRKESDAANAVMEGLVSKDPDNVDNLIIYARIKHSLNQLSEAKSAYEKIIAADPTQKNIYLLLGELYVDEGSLDFALQIYKGLVKQFPDFAVGYYLMGRVFYLKGDPVAAEKNFRKVLDMDPGFDEARYDLISLYKKASQTRYVTVQPGDTFESICRKIYDDYDEKTKQAVMAYNPGLKDADKIRAGQKIRFPESTSKPEIRQRRPYDKKIIELYQEILERNPDDIRAAMELGLYYHEQGKTADAEKLFKALGERSRNDKHVIRYVLELYVDKKQYDSALTVLRHMLKGSPGSSDINYIIGLACDGKKDRESAIRHFKQINPGSTFFKNAVLHTVFLYQEAEKTADAIGYLENVISRQPREPEFYLYLGTLYEESRSFEKAEAVLKHGISIAPDNGKLYFRIGVVYDKWGKKEDSIRMMKEVIRLDPEDANALNYLGYTYAEMGKNLDEAEELIKKALRLKPDDGYIMDSLGWVYYKKGIHDKALEILKKAASIVPDDPIILEHLGDAYLKNNDQQKALENYQKSMTNADDNKERLGNKIRELKNSGY